MTWRDRLDAGLGGDPFERRTDDAGTGQRLKRQLVAQLQKLGCGVTIDDVPAAA